MNVCNLNQQKNIYSIEKANWFLKENLKNYGDKISFTYLRTYPQLAGKIAYIYYRFDLINNAFLESIAKHNKELYLKDRDSKYINTIINKLLNPEYKSNRSYKQFHTELLNDKDRDIKECQMFLESLTQALCKEFNLPLEKVLFYNKKPSNFISFGAYKNNIVWLNEYIIKSYFKELVETVFHECRHFYIEKKY